MNLAGHTIWNALIINKNRNIICELQHFLQTMIRNKAMNCSSDKMRDKKEAVFLGKVLEYSLLYVMVAMCTKIHAALRICFYMISESMKSILEIVSQTEIQLCLM